MLVEGRLRAAFQHARAAAEHSPSFENGMLLSEIARAAREHFILEARVRLPEPPKLAVQLGEGTLVAATSAGLYRADMVSGKVSAPLALPTAPIRLEPLGTDRVLAQFPGNRLEIFAAEGLRSLAAFKADDEIVDLAVNPTGNTLGLLFRRRMEVRDPRSGFRLQDSAKVDVRKPKSYYGVWKPRLNMSPSGKTLLTQTASANGKHYLWTRSGRPAREIRLDVPQAQLRDDTRIVAFASGSHGAEYTRVLLVSTAEVLDRNYKPLTIVPGGDSAETAIVNYKSPPGEPIAGTYANETREFWLAPSRPVATNTADSQNLDPAEPDSLDVELAVIADDTAVDFIGLQPPVNRIYSVRYDSLWPHTSDRLERIGFDPHARRLLLAKGAELLVFRLSASRAAATLMHWADFWSVASSADAAWSALVDTKGSVVLRRFSFDKFDRDDFPLAAPAKTAGFKPGVVVPWGLAVTPDGRTAAVLFQEASQPSVSGDFFGKTIAIYDVPAERPAGSLPVKASIPLPDYYGVNGRDNRLLRLSPDGRIVFFAAENRLWQAYDVATRSLAWSVTGLWGVAASPDGSLLVSFQWREAAPIEVRELSSGRIVFKSKESFLVERVAFRSDRYLLASVVASGGAGNRLLTFDLSTGQQVSETPMALVPVAVSADGKRMVAIQLGPLRVTGSAVLADTKTGRVIAVLNPGAHILNKAHFSATGDRLVLEKNRWSFLRFDADPLERLVRALETPFWPDAPVPRQTGGALLSASSPP